MKEFYPSEPTPLIKEAASVYEELEMGDLPQELQRDSRYYYYLSVYPGLRYMSDVTSEKLPTLPDSINSAYVHTPYCTGVCNFCSYYLTTIKPDQDQSPVANYFETVKKEISHRARETELDISYIYFGGGTPSLIPPKILSSFFEFGERKQIFSDQRQGTLELHPEFFANLEHAQGFINILKVNGVRRVSIGFQSSDEEILNSTNRRHDTSFLKEAIGFLKDNNMVVNLDLMYGLPDLTLDHWEQTLVDAVNCDPDSITPYFLFVNEGTLMRRKVDKNHIKLPNHQVIQTQHIMAQKFLEAHGYYELPSDFFGRIDGDPSEFKQDDLPSSSASLPLGAGSYGYYDNTQFFNQFSIAKYRKAIDAGDSPIWRSHRFEESEGLHRDIMFSFKNSPYLDLDLCAQRYDVNPLERFEPQFEKLSNLNLIKINENLGRIVLTSKGRLCVEEICWQFVLPNLKDEVNRKTPPSLKRKLKRHHFAPLYELITRQK